jgi:septum formation protein
MPRVLEGISGTVDARLVLASASPRRAQLMRDAGFLFQVAHPPEDDPAELGLELPPAQLAEFLSRMKAKSVASMFTDELIIGADTVAALEGRIFGKPVDRADAKRILQSISGTTHQVITGLTVIDAASGKTITRHDVTQVTMRALSEAELEGYLDTGAWRGKAGAYGIQDHGDEFVTKVEGSFSNVVGLPMELLDHMLAEFHMRH